MTTLRYAGWGALAGATGSTALNAVTYLDKAARDPKEWDGQTWVTDIVPHLAYGAVTVATLHALDSR